MIVEEQEVEMKKLEEEKEDALAAQDAAEEALRRVYTHQQEDDPLPLESVIAPLEAQIKFQKHQVLISNSLPSLFLCVLQTSCIDYSLFCLFTDLCASRRQESVGTADKIKRISAS